MSSLGIFNKETKTYQKVAGDVGAAILDKEMSDTSENPVQNKVIKKYVDDKQVKHGDGLVVTEDGTLKVSLDGTTLTMDQVNNVIKLADTLKDAIIGAFPAANVVNNLTTTEEGFALDARQANPNVDGTLAKQLSDLNGRLNYFQADVSWKDNSKPGINLFYYENSGDIVALDIPHRYVFVVVLMFNINRACAVAIKWDNVSGEQSRMWINQKQEIWSNWREL